MAAATGWRIAMYGKCGSTLAYLSSLGNQNKARVLKTATHLSLYTSKHHSLVSSFNIDIMAIMWPTHTITFFTWPTRMKWEIILVATLLLHMFVLQVKVQYTINIIIVKKYEIFFLLRMWLLWEKNISIQNYLALLTKFLGNKTIFSIQNFQFQQDIQVTGIIISQ